MTKFYIYFGIAVPAFWASFTEGKKHGFIGLIAGVALGICFGLIYFYLTRLIGRWFFERLDRAKSAPKSLRVMLAICLGLIFFALLGSSYPVGERATDWTFGFLF